MIKRILIILFLIITFGCHMKKSRQPSKSVSKVCKEKLPEKVKALKNVDVYSSNQEPKFNIELKKSISFPQYGKKPFFNYIGQFSVDKFNKVYISDKHSIKVFASDGEHITTLGKQGRGPGEFNNFGALTLKISSRKMYVYDDILQRISVFDLDSLGFSHMINLNPQKWSRVKELRHSLFKDFYVYNAYNILIGFKSQYTQVNKRKRYIKYYMMNQDGNLISDKIFEHIDIKFYDGSGAPSPLRTKSVTSMPVASTRSIMMDVDNNGFIYSNWTENFLIKIFTHKGKYLRSIYYSFRKSSLNKNAIIASYKDSKQLQRRAQAKNYSDTWPAINYFFIDDVGRIWVSTITENEDTFKWFVLKNSGKLLAKFEWPGQRLKRNYQERQIKMVKNGFLYAKKTNAKGLDQVVKYKIQFKKNR